MVEHSPQILASEDKDTILTCGGIFSFTKSAVSDKDTILTCGGIFSFTKSAVTADSHTPVKS